MADNPLADSPLRLLPNVWRSYVLIFNMTNQIINERLHEEMRKEGFGLTPREAWVLMAASEKPCSQGLIAQCLNINTNVMVRTSDKLERMGLVRRIRHEKNRRQQMIEVTTKGHNLIGRLFHGWDERSARLFYPVPMEIVHQYVTYAKTILENYYEKNKSWPTRRLAP